MEKTYKYRAYPSKEQQSILNLQMRLAKGLYNRLLDQSQRHFKDTGKTFTKYDMNKWISKFKKENPEYDQMYSQVLQNMPDRVFKAYQNFFRRVKEKRNGKRQPIGFPRFKSFVSSLTYPQSGFKIQKKRVELSKIGAINFVNYRGIEGRIKTISIKKTRSGEWYMTIATENEEKPFATNGKPQVGMDLGLIEYATLSENIKIPNLKIQKGYEQKLSMAHKIISRRRKGSKNRAGARIRLARIHEHIARKRADYLHKLSHNLVNSYSLIAYENLNIRGMMKDHHLAGSISDVSWNEFLQFLCYKAESAGCKAIAVDPRNTSRMCSGCGNVQEIGLSDRIFVCDRCALQIDRDLNASINILRKATDGRSGIDAFGEKARPPNEASLDELGTRHGGIDDK